MTNICKKIINKIEVIKIIYNSILKKNGFLNVINQDNIINDYKKNNFDNENTLDKFIIFILENFSKDIESYLKHLDKTNKNFIYIFKFIIILIGYLVDKYYYKLNTVHFIIKSCKNVDVFNFFITFNKIKSALNLKPEEDKPIIRITYLYTMVLLAIIYLFPISWFFMKVVTDPQNFVLYFFENIQESLIT